MNNKKMYIAIGLFIIFIFVLCMIYVRDFVPEIRNLLISYKLIPQSEAFTELYFDNHLQLPTIFTSGTPVQFSFTIHNLEYKDMNYSYEVYAVTTEKKLKLDSGSIPLFHDKFKTISENIKLNDLSQRTEIIVNLISKNQQIDFWITP